MLRYSYSRLSANHLLTLLQANYPDLAKATCCYFTSGLHDNYLVECNSARYICRVYRNAWRSVNEISFELEFLNHLDKQSSPVAAPLLCKSGSLFFTIDCPEGQRCIALFHYAEGNTVDLNHDQQAAFLLGQAVAKVHHDSADFHPQYSRKRLELPFLLRESTKTILPFLTNENDAHFLKAATKTLDQYLLLPEPSLPTVICQGDVNPGNFHMDNARQITLFDFDQCGYGPRIFEIAKLQTSVERLPNQLAINKLFIEGYQTTAPELTENEWEVLPYYRAIAIIWVMAIRPMNSEWIGHQMLQDDFWQQRLGLLRQMEIFNG